MRHFTGKQRLFTILLGIEIVYLTVALMIPPLPGWKMFSQIDRVRHVSLIADGQKQVFLKDYLPSTFYEMSSEQAQQVAEFICHKRNNVQDWYLQIENETEKDAYVFSQNNCLPRKK